MTQWFAAGIQENGSAADADKVNAGC